MFFAVPRAAFSVCLAFSVLPPVVGSTFQDESSSALVQDALGQLDSPSGARMPVYVSTDDTSRDTAATPNFFVMQPAATPQQPMTLVQTVNFPRGDSDQATKEQLPDSPAEYLELSGEPLSDESQTAPAPVSSGFIAPAQVSSGFIPEMQAAAGSTATNAQALPPRRLRLHTASVQEHHSKIGEADITTLRPGAASGTADKVSFGVFAKSFYGTSLKDNKFTVDAVLLLKWTDPRVIELIPAGVDSVSMSGRDAMKSIWMPEVVITNRDIRKYELISTSVTLLRSGEVTKVERATVVCMNRFELEEYPFDEQILQVKVASAKYMLHELVLQPDDDAGSSGVKDGLFKSFPYRLEDWKVVTFEETDGALKKSRGVLQIRVRRTFDKYGESHLLPTVLFLSISWAVFWFPFQNPFITPRLALSILALLTFTNLVIKSSAALPGGAPTNWNDVLNYQIQALMFCTIVGNVFSEVCKHQLELQDFAQMVNHEFKVLMPVLSIIVLTIVLTAGEYKYLSVQAGSIVTKVVIVVVIGTYTGCSLTGLNAAHNEKKENEERKKADELRQEKSAP